MVPQLILKRSTEHALSTAYVYSKNLMFIVVSAKQRLLLPSDSLLLRCAGVLIGYDSMQAHHP